MNGIKALGWVTVDAQGGVCFGVEETAICAVADTMVGVDEHNFSATYNPGSKSWTAAWKWSEGKKPDVLKNLVEAYSVPQEIKDLYGEKLHMWKEDS